jgi:hypothetical protein
MFGIVIVIALALAVGLIYVTHARQSGFAPVAEETVTGIGTAAYNATTTFPLPSSSCARPSGSAPYVDVKDSLPPCVLAGELYPPYWKPLLADFMVSYSYRISDAPPNGFTDSATYTVDFGDGNTGTLASRGNSCVDDGSCGYSFYLEHTYSAAGLYTVRFYKNGKQIADTLKVPITIPASVCKLEDTLIPNDTGITAYDDQCKGEGRTCSNGILSGSYKHATCPLWAQKQMVNY